MRDVNATGNLLTMRALQKNKNKSDKICSRCWYVRKLVTRIIMLDNDDTDVICLAEWQWGNN
jgi:hypothetical protein